MIRTFSSFWGCRSNSRRSGTNRMATRTPSSSTTPGPLRSTFNTFTAASVQSSGFTGPIGFPCSSKLSVSPEQKHLKNSARPTYSAAASRAGSAHRSTRSACAGRAVACCCRHPAHHRTDSQRPSRTRPNSHPTTLRRRTTTRTLSSFANGLSAAKAVDGNCGQVTPAHP